MPVRSRPADLTLGLALVHHLAISNQLPFGHVAELFAAVSRRTIVEFVPRGDSQVQRLLSRRLDTFPAYEPGLFEAAFARHFRILERVKVRDSERTLYLMERNGE